MFWIFVIAVAVYAAFNIVQFVNTGDIFRIYLVAAAVLVLIIGVLFLSPFVYHGKIPFESKIEEMKR